MLRHSAPFILSLALLIGCSEEPVTRIAAQTPEQKANATASSRAVTGEDSVLQIAIPVEISASGVRVMGEGQLIRAPRPQPGAGPQLVVTLQGESGEGKFQRQYELPDPRLSEIEGQGQRVLPRAQTFVYVELADRASQIDIKPKSETVPATNTNMEFVDKARSTIQLAQIAGKLCRDAHQASPLCQQARIK